MQIVITVQSLCSPDGLGGQTVIGIARVLYKRGEVLDPVDGALELDLKDRFVLLDVAADGERLRVEDRRWEDPFAEPLSPENRAYVEEQGKWVRVDCSRQEPYSEFVGQIITEARLLENQFHRVAGVRISVATTSLWFVVEGDECHVHWAHPIGFTEVRCAEPD